MGMVHTGYRDKIALSHETEVKNQGILVLEMTVNRSFCLYFTPYPSLTIESLALEKEVFRILRQSV